MPCHHTGFDRHDIHILYKIDDKTKEINKLKNKKTKENIGHIEREKKKTQQYIVLPSGDVARHLKITTYQVKKQLEEKAPLPTTYQV